MNIWMVAPYPPQAGGVPAHVQELACRLSKRHKVRIITYGRKARKAPAGTGIEITEVPVIDVKFLRGLSFFIGTALKLRSLSKSEKADVIHAHFMHPPGTAVAFYMKFWGKGERVVVTAHGSDVLCLSRGRIGRALVKWAGRKCDALICVSSHLAHVAAGMGMRRRIKVVHNGIDAKALPRDAKEKLRKELQLPQGKIVAFSGRLSEAKGADIFMVLAEHLCWKEKDVTFLIVGSGPLEGRLWHMAKERGLSSRVMFAGQKSRGEALRYVKASDVLVVPSRLEGFGLSALEAAAMGVPVVASHADALPEVLSPMSFTDNMPAAVMNVLKNAAFRKDMIEKNRKKAESFTLERMASETEKIYGKGKRQTTSGMAS